MLLYLHPQRKPHENPSIGIVLEKQKTLPDFEELKELMNTD